MKKPTPKLRERQRRLMAYRWRHDYIARRLRWRRKKNRKKYGKDARVVKAPEKFDFIDHNILPLLNFISSLEKAASSPETDCIILDFSSTSLMVADGTLYFLAYLDRLKTLYPRKRFRMRKPTDPIVEQVLHHVGISSIFGTDKQLPIDSLHKTVKHWHTASGYDVNTEKAGNVFGSFKGKITSELSRSVYKGVSEAMTNCFHHAYDDQTPQGCRKWWLFSRTYLGEVQVVFCDLGIGIPNSLYQRSTKVDVRWPTKLETWIKENVVEGRPRGDALKIKAAIEIGQSRTKLPHRGKGLKQMVDFLDELGHNEAKVVIYSGSGVYRRTPRKGQTKETLSRLSDKKRKSKILGTLIHWSIPLVRETEV